MAVRLTRRGLAVLALAGGAGALVARRLSSPSSGPHSPYFAELSKLLAGAGIGTSVCVVDVARVRRNAERIAACLGGRRLRLAVKSLPSLPLLDALPSRAFMAFNPSMLAALWDRDPACDVVLGKPLPIAAVRALHAANPERFAGATGTQWLIDSPRRLAEYDAFAREAGLSLKVSFEIDVGLHRGGFADSATLKTAAASLPGTNLSLAGLMGYDAHVGKTPALLGLDSRAWANSQQRYREAIETIGGQPALTLNGGGSLTFGRHAAGSVANDVSIGSAFVLPSDFDGPATRELEPAAFIAAPVLKRVSRVEIPGLEALAGLHHAVAPDGSRGVFVFGGNWLAHPVSPPGLSHSALYGRSSNQDLLVAGPGLELDPGDFVFFRPTQSEAVLNSLGELVAVDGTRVERWGVLQ